MVIDPFSATSSMAPPPATLPVVPTHEPGVKGDQD